MTALDGACAPASAVQGEPLRVLIADEGALVRESLRAALSLLGRSLSISEVDCWEGVADHCNQATVLDVALISEGLLPGACGEAFSSVSILLSGARVVLVGGRGGTVRVHSALRIGIKGYVSRSAGVGLLSTVLQFVLDGGTYVSPEAWPETDLAEDVGSLSVKCPACDVSLDFVDNLTTRQREVLQQLMKGRSNKLICRELGMAMGTAKSHLAAIYSALQVNSRSAAIAAVARLSLDTRLHGLPRRPQLP